MSKIITYQWGSVPEKVSFVPSTYYEWHSEKSCFWFYKSVLSLAVFHITVSTHHQNIDMLVSFISFTIYYTGYLAVNGKLKLSQMVILDKVVMWVTNLSFVLKRTQDVVIIRCCLNGKLTYSVWLMMVCDTQEGFVTCRNYTYVGLPHQHRMVFYLFIF